MAYFYSQMHNQAVLQWRGCHESNWVQSGRAVAGGHDVNGETIYVGRALVEGDVIPGKVVPSHRVCYVPWGGKEHRSHEYQVLTTVGNAQIVWLPASNGELPSGAIQGGMTQSGEPLYVGRQQHQGSQVIGKIHPSHRCLYIPFGGQEISKSAYDVLCVRTIHF